MVGREAARPAFAVRVERGRTRSRRDFLYAQPALPGNTTAGRGRAWPVCVGLAVPGRTQPLQGLQPALPVLLELTTVGLEAAWPASAQPRP